MKVRDKRIKIDIIDTPEGNFSWGIYKIVNSVATGEPYWTCIDSGREKTVEGAFTRANAAAKNYRKII